MFGCVTGRRGWCGYCTIKDMENSSHSEGGRDFIGPLMPHMKMDLDRTESSQGIGIATRQPLERLVRMREIARLPFANPLDRLFVTMRGKRIEEELIRISAELDQELEAQERKKEQVA